MLDDLSQPQTFKFDQGPLLMRARSIAHRKSTINCAGTLSYRCCKFSSASTENSSGLFCINFSNSKYLALTKAASLPAGTLPIAGEIVQSAIPKDTFVKDH